MRWPGNGRSEVAWGGRGQGVKEPGVVGVRWEG